MWEQWDHLILPVCALSVGTIAAYARYVRSSMVDNLNEQYVRTARAKGLSEFRVVFVHTLRNAMFPVITMIGLYIPAMFSWRPRYRDALQLQRHGLPVLPGDRPT